MSKPDSAVRTLRHYARWHSCPKCGRKYVKRAMMVKHMKAEMAASQTSRRSANAGR